VAGLGVVGGRHVDRSRLLADGRVTEAKNVWGGWLAEVYAEQRLTQHLALRGGLSVNGYRDPFVIQPQGSLVLRF
jgi:hypothetical protein